MTTGGRQRRDGSPKRVQLTSGDHGGPKDKKSKTRRTAVKPDGKAGRAAGLREVERFREATRVAEQRRAARQKVKSATAGAVGAKRPESGAEQRAAMHASVQAHLTECLRAAQDHDWALLKESAVQVAAIAACLEAGDIGHSTP